MSATERGPRAGFGIAAAGQVRMAAIAWSPPFWICAAAATLLAISCVGLQADRRMSVPDSADFARLEALELRLPGLLVAPVADALAEASAALAALESEPIAGESWSARLAAMDGELALLSGRRESALGLLAKARALLPGEPAVAFLAARLEREPVARERLLRGALAATGTPPPLLLAELGSSLSDQNRFGEAVAAFDEALPTLPAEWQAVYSPRRDAAFARLGTESAHRDLAAWLAMEAIDLEGMAMVCQGSTALLDRMTGARDWKAGKLFDALQAAGLFGPGGHAPADRATRAQAAFLLWNLLALKEGDRAMATAYHDRYAKARGSAAASPVPDIALDAWYFDAALGCVEREFLSLPDGFRFEPDAALSGSAFWKAATRADGQ